MIKIEKLKTAYLLTKEDVIKLIEDFKKISPPSILGIYSELDVHQKQNDDNECILKLHIVGETFREHYDLSSGIKPWYNSLKPELEDFLEKDVVSYEKANKFFESLADDESGLIWYNWIQEPRIRFSDFWGAYIHNVITMEFSFGSSIDSSSLHILYPKIGELK